MKTKNGLHGDSMCYRQSSLTIILLLVTNAVNTQKIHLLKGHDFYD